MENLKIFYIEDDKELGSTMKDLMEAQGFLVQWFTDRGEANEYLDAHPHAFDLVVSDFRVPSPSYKTVLEGFKVTQTLCKAHGLPLLLVSGERWAKGEAPHTSYLPKLKLHSHFIPAIRQLLMA